MLLSVCGICKNEALNLPDFLESVKGFADEVLIVDTGSTDESLQILKRDSQVQVVEFPWNQHFGDARNQGLLKAQGKYILALDMDERLRPEDGELLREELQKGRHEAFFLPIWNLASRNWRQDNSLLYEQSTLRLFRNTPKVRFEGRVHETVDEGLFSSVGVLSIPILHVGYAEGLLEKKEERNRELILKDHEEDPRNPRKMALAGLALIPESRGLELLVQALPSLRDGDRYRALWALILDHSDQEAFIAEILKMKKDSFIAWFVRGNQAFEAQNLELAREHYEKAWQGSRSETYLPGGALQTVMDRLGILLAIQGRLDDAALILEEQEKRFGLSPQLFHQLLKLYTALGDRNRAYPLIRRMPQELNALDEDKRLEIVKYLKILTGR